MKRTLLVITAFFIHLHLLSQPMGVYLELNTGITTNLTSASSNSLNFNNAQVWACGNNGVIIRSTNTGINWINQTGNGVPTNVNLNSICFIAIDTAVCAGNTGATTYVYRTVNGGTNWTQVFTQANGTINAIGFKNSSLGFMTGNPVGGRWSLWKTTNKGLTWDSTGMYISQAGSETGFPNSIAVRHNYVLFGTNNTRIYRSTNSGVTWSFISAMEQNTTSLWVYNDTSGYSFIYAGGSKTFRTTNNGSNWQNNIFADTLNNVVGFGPGVYGVYDNMPMCVYGCRNNNKIYFAGTPSSGFIAEYTSPSGSYNYMTGDFSQMYGNPSYYFAVRNNGGITRINDFRGGGIKQLSSLLPDKYELYQNYPNPFNPVTNIRFAVRQYGPVILTVFDETGKEVYKPVNELMKPGTYEVSWDAAALASGIYFYRIITEGYAETRKMIIIK